MRFMATLTGLLLLVVLGTETCAQSKLDRSENRRVTGERPLVLGKGVGRFRVGSQLMQDDFENLEHWVIQIQERSGFEPAIVEAKDNALNCLVPGRGCTVWYKQKIPTRVAITYNVLCPTPEPAIKGVEPRDINNFWMAGDPEDPDQGLFDSARYSGNFRSYDRIHGFYASTGGGRSGAANVTTRMRRYPRRANGEPTEHMALTNRDGNADYLIKPDEVMTVQLVAYDDVIQYIVDGKLNYEVALGDRIQLEGRDSEDQIVAREATYDRDRFPTLQEGYFGFRMVGTHHVYSNFRVFALEPDEASGTSRREVDRTRPMLTVSSLPALREALKESNQRIVLETGEYEVEAREGFRLSGSDNDVDLSGAHIKVPLDRMSGNVLFSITGNNNTFRGGNLESTYPDGSTDITDYGSYNQGKRFGGMNEFVVSGDDNRVIGVKMTVRGSYPYGYGNMYGIGAGSAVRLRKHCGIRITGDRAIIDGCDIKMEAFGHAIYVQGGDRTTVRNTVIEGTLRPSNDCYSETDDGDLAKRFDYQIQWPQEVKGLPIPRDHMLNCAEDGIRAYRGAGDMIVENCVVKKMRGGIKLYMAKSATVTNCQVLDCVIQGYSLPSRGRISNSSGNAAYGPLLYIHSDRHTNQSIELEVIPSSHSLGDHPLAAIKGQGHTVTFTYEDAAKQETLRPIIVGYPMRFDFLCIDYPEVPEGYEKHFQEYSPSTYKASAITIDNGTPHPVVLGSQSEGNSITSLGPIRDLGSSNRTEAR